MSRYRNISGGQLDVPFFDLTAEDGEVVDMPDVQPDGVSPVTYSAAHWEPVTDSVAKPAKADDTSAKGM